MKPVLLRFLLVLFSIASGFYLMRHTAAAAAHAVSPLAIRSAALRPRAVGAPHRLLDAVRPSAAGGGHFAAAAVAAATCAAAGAILDQDLRLSLAAALAHRPATSSRGSLSPHSSFVHSPRRPHQQVLAGAETAQSSAAAVSSAPAAATDAVAAAPALALAAGAPRVYSSAPGATASSLAAAGNIPPIGASPTGQAAPGDVGSVKSESLGRCCSVEEGDRSRPSHFLRSWRWAGNPTAAAAQECQAIRCGRTAAACGPRGSSGSSRCVRLRPRGAAVIEARHLRCRDLLCHSSNSRTTEALSPPPSSLVVEAASRLSSLRDSSSAVTEGRLFCVVPLQAEELHPQATTEGDVRAAAAAAQRVLPLQQTTSRQQPLLQQQPQQRLLLSLPQEQPAKLLQHRTAERAAEQTRGVNSSSSNAGRCCSFGLSAWKVLVKRQTGKPNSSSSRSWRASLIGSTGSPRQHRSRSPAYLAHSSSSSYFSSSRNTSQWTTCAREKDFFSSTDSSATKKWASSALHSFRSSAPTSSSSSTAYRVGLPSGGSTSHSDSTSDSTTRASSSCCCGNSSRRSRRIRSIPARDSSSNSDSSTVRLASHRVASYNCGSRHLTIGQGSSTPASSRPPPSSSIACSHACAADRRSSRLAASPPASRCAGNSTWALGCKRAWWGRSSGSNSKDSGKSNGSLGEGQQGLLGSSRSVWDRRLKRMQASAAGSSPGTRGMGGELREEGSAGSPASPPLPLSGGSVGPAPTGTGEPGEGFRVIEREAAARLPLRWLHFDRIDSTQQWVLRNLPLLQTYGLTSSQWLVVSASEQTAAIGTRHGSSASPARWISPVNNVSATYVIPWPVSLSSRLISFPQTAAAAVCQLLQDMQLEPKMKWINDVLVDGRKIAGILCANPSLYLSAAKTTSADEQQQQQCMAVLVGVGINIEKAPDAQLLASEATSTMPQAAICVAEALQEKRRRRQQQQHHPHAGGGKGAHAGAAAAAPSDHLLWEGGDAGRMPSLDMFDILDALHAKMFECLGLLQREGFLALRPFVMSHLAWLGEYVELESEDGPPAAAAEAAAAGNASSKLQAGTAGKASSKLQAAAAGEPSSKLQAAEAGKASSKLQAAEAGSASSKLQAAVPTQAVGTATAGTKSSKLSEAVGSASAAAHTGDDQRRTHPPSKQVAAALPHAACTGDKSSKLTAGLPPAAVAAARGPAAGDDHHQPSKLTSAAPASGVRGPHASSSSSSKQLEALPSAAAAVEGATHGGGDSSKLLQAIPGTAAGAAEAGERAIPVVEPASVLGEEQAEEGGAGEFHEEEQTEEELHRGGDRLPAFSACYGHPPPPPPAAAADVVAEDSSSTLGRGTQGARSSSSSSTGKGILAAGILQGIDGDGALLIKGANGEITRHVCGHLIRP